MSTSEQKVLSLDESIKHAVAWQKAYLTHTNKEQAKKDPEGTETFIKESIESYEKEIRKLIESIKSLKLDTAICYPSNYFNDPKLGPYWEQQGNINSASLITDYTKIYRVIDPHAAGWGDKNRLGLTNALRQLLDLLNNGAKINVVNPNNQSTLLDFVNARCENVDAFNSQAKLELVNLKVLRQVIIQIGAKSTNEPSKARSLTNRHSFHQPASSEVATSSPLASSSTTPTTPLIG